MKKMPKLHPFRVWKLSAATLVAESLPLCLLLLNRLSAEGDLTDTSAQALLEGVVLVLDPEGGLRQLVPKTTPVTSVVLSCLQGLACHEKTSVASLGHLLTMAGEKVR